MKIHLELEILQMFDLLSTFYIRRYTQYVYIYYYKHCFDG